MDCKVAILLATYNGSLYIEEQLESFIAQTHKDWHLFARDDGSTDDTVDILNLFASKYKNVTVVDNFGDFTGSAAGNFFKLISFSDYQGFTHVSLADQDDVWAPGKLKAALKTMQLEEAGGYSSNLVSYDNAMKKAGYIDKSQSQKEFDYLFQGASAGCTYVLTRDVCLLVQEKIAAIESYRGRSHDWLIYALCRTNNIHWVFDKEAHIFYRQHANNVYGAMGAFSGVLARLKLLRSGWYRENILWIAEKSGADIKCATIVDRIKRNSFFDKIYLSKLSSKFRRNKKESRALVFILFFLF